MHITFKDCHYKFSYFQPAEGVRYAEGVEEISEDEINSIAEELTKEELEELEVCWKEKCCWNFFSFFFFSGGEGGWPYERRTVTFAVNYADKTFFIKRS